MRDKRMMHSSIEGNAASGCEGGRSNGSSFTFRCTQLVETGVSENHLAKIEFAPKILPNFT